MFCVSHSGKIGPHPKDFILKNQTALFLFFRHISHNTHHTSARMSWLLRDVAEEKRLENKADSLNQELRREGDKVAQMKKDIGALSEAKTRLEDINAKLSNETQALNTKLEHRNDDIRTLSDTVASLRAELEEAKRQVASVKSEDSSNREKLESMTAKNTALESRDSSLEEEKRHLKARIRELELELENLKCETKEGRSQITDLAVKGSSYEQRVKGLESDKIHLEAWNKEKERHATALQTEKTQLEKERAARQQELTDLKETKVKLEVSVKDLEKRERELAQKIAAQQAAFDAKEKEMRRSIEAERDRMAKDTREDKNQQQDFFKNMMTTMLDLNKQATERQDREREKQQDFTKYLLGQQHELPGTMSRLCYQPVMEAASVPISEQHEKRKELEGPQSDDGK